MRLLLLVPVLLLAGCGDKPEPVSTMPTPVILPQNYQWLTPTETEQMIQRNKSLGIIDVRNDIELQDGRIAGAMHCPYMTGNEARLKTLDKTKPWLVYCTIGGRSELTAQTMAKLGFKEVYLLKGGFAEWLAQGKATVQ